MKKINNLLKFWENFNYSIFIVNRWIEFYKINSLYEKCLITLKNLSRILSKIILNLNEFWILFTISNIFGLIFLRQPL